MKFFEFLRRTVDRPWDWNELSKNPAIRTEDVMSELHYPWNWKLLCQNPSLSVRFLLEHEAEGLDFDALSNHLDLTWYDVTNFAGRPWNYAFLSGNPCVTWTLVKAFPKIPWNFAWLSRNPSIPVDVVLHNPEHRWDWDYVSRRATMNQILAHLYLPWDWWTLSHLALITDELLDHPEITWRATGLSVNPSVTLELMERHPEIEWCWSRNRRYLTLDYVMAHPGIEWNWHELFLLLPMSVDQLIRHNITVDWDKYSYNPCVTLEDYERFPDKPWTIRALNCQAKGLHLADVKRLGWNTRIYCYHPDVTIEELMDCREDEVDWSHISSRTFTI